ncbi:unnamed protein product [Clonostachys rhizophaga]|uniref:Uncharacterized protein n=1 Tax=Clonostachys rhizophaga TaxID=160324 RepID=A0A9N9V975_9HYPO|nr:unnamed protein product [Clonostachys rhizophaga]
MGPRTLSSSTEPQILCPAIRRFCVQQSADSVSNNPPSKNEASKAYAHYCGRKRLPQIHRTNMKLHSQNTYGHELDLLQAFRDTIAGLSLEAPRALMPPVIMQQLPMHYSIQGLLPPP